MTELTKLSEYREYREKTEPVLHRIYDLLYFDDGTYNSDKEWEPETLEAIADAITALMGEPEDGTKEWPPIAGLPSLRKAPYAG